MSFFGKIDFNELSEVDRSIYHYMSENSDKIQYMRVREIANESHTSASSVMRFIRKIGYSSFAEFKTMFQKETGSTYETGDFSSGSLILDQGNFPKDIERKITMVAERMLTAENIVFFGIGTSGILCEYAARRLATIGYNTFAVTDPTFPISSKLKNTSENILVSISVSGNTTEVVEVVNGFKNKEDYTTVCITGNEHSTLALMTHYILSYHAKVERLRLHEDLSTQIPIMYVIEYLTNELRKLGDA